MELRNIRRTTVHGEDVVLADFVIADGRTGSVGVPAKTYDDHGKRALEDEAMGCAAFVRIRGERPTEYEQERL